MTRSDADDGARKKELESAVAAIWERWKPQTLSRAAVIEEAAGALLGGRLSAELRWRAHREAHRLSGSLVTFGLTEGSVLAQKIEVVLWTKGELGRREGSRLSELAAALVRVLDGAPQAE